MKVSNCDTEANTVKLELNPHESNALDSIVSAVPMLIMSGSMASTPSLIKSTRIVEELLSTSQNGSGTIPVSSFTAVAEVLDYATSHRLVNRGVKFGDTNPKFVEHMWLDAQHARSYVISRAYLGTKTGYRKLVGLPAHNCDR